MIPVNSPLLNGNEKKYLIECIDTGWISSEGPFVKKFETQMAKYVGVNYGVSCTNGTAALEMAIKALDIGPNDEVILPSFTIISCCQAIVKAGATPVLVDSDFDSFNVKVDDIESKITKNTKAIMIVHIYGLPVDVDPILELSKKYNLKIIEDAAEVHGQKYKNRMCGSLGDIGIFSFYPNKHITTGEGGMVLMNDENLYKKCRSLRNLCFSEDSSKRFIHEEIGWNLRMTNVQAAIGCAQLERINEFVDKKRWIGKLYHDLLSDISTINLPIQYNSFAENIYWVFAITLKDECNLSVKEVMNKLSELKIGSRPFFYPLHLQPVFKNLGFFKNENYPNSTKLYERGFYIPSGLSLSEKDILKVSKALHQILK